MTPENTGPLRILTHPAVSQCKYTQSGKYAITLKPGWGFGILQKSNGLFEDSKDFLASDPKRIDEDPFSFYKD